MGAPPGRVSGRVNAERYLAHGGAYVANARARRCRRRIIVAPPTVLLTVLLWHSALGVTPAQAHPIDLMKPNRAGPIIRGETTIAELRAWFGRPTGRTIERVGCVRVIRARWGSELTVYASRGEVRIAEAIFVRARRIGSAEHGDLRMHTSRGLRVGDSEDRLRELYPRAKGETHAGHTHYRLGTGDFGAYLMAKVVDREVVQLEAWPYEFC
jgi:hypothetical protein